MNASNCASCDDANCEECSSYFFGACTKCRSGYVLQSSGTCSLVCSEGEYNDSAINACLSCYSTCATCSGPESNNCLSCSNSFRLQPDGTCGSDCDIGTYSSGGNCLECSTNCGDCWGTCKMCKDDYGGCVARKCEAGYFLSNGKCYKCSEQCEECTETATNCKSCTQANYTPSSNGCKCEGNYFIDSQGDCTLRPVTVKLISLSNEKEFDLEFSRSLNTNISYSDLTVTAYSTDSTSQRSIGFKSAIDLTWSLSTIQDKRIYRIALTSSSLSAPFELNIDFNNSKLIKDTIGSSLSASGISATIGEEPETPVTPTTPETPSTQNPDTGSSGGDSEDYDWAKYWTNYIILSIGSGLLVIGVFLGKSAVVWPYMRLVQVVCYIPIINIGIPEVLVVFCKYLNFFVKQFNVFEIVYDQGDYADPDAFDRADLAGFDSPLFLRNCGGLITLLLVLALVGLFIWGLARAINSDYLYRITTLFKGPVWLRFGIELTLTITICCLIQFKHGSGSDTFSIFSLALAIIFFVNSIQIVIISFIGFPLGLIALYHYQISTYDVKFMEKFSTLFDEFDIQDSKQKLLFYPLFNVLYHFIFALFIIFIESHGGVAISCIALRTIVTYKQSFLYTLPTKPFLSKLNFASNIINEFAQLLIFILLGIIALDLNEDSRDTVKWMIIVLVFIGLGLITICCGFFFFLPMTQRVQSMNSQEDDTSKLPGKDNKVEEDDTFQQEYQRQLDQTFNLPPAKEQPDYGDDYLWQRPRSPEVSNLRYVSNPRY